MGRHSRKGELSPAEARRLEQAVQGVSPAEQRAAIEAAFEGAKQAREAIEQKQQGE